VSIPPLIDRHTCQEAAPFVVSDGWLYGWGLASVGLGGASLVVPLYVVELGGGPATLGVLAAAAAAAGAPGGLGVGWLSDRTGRLRPYVIGAVAVVAVALLAVPALTSRTAVVVANAAIWLAFAAAVPVLTLLVVVGTPEADWSDRIGRLNQLQGVGWALCLLVGFLAVLAGDALGLSRIAAQRLVCLLCGGSAAAGGLVVAGSLPADDGVEPRPRRLRRAIRAANTFGVRGAGFPFTPRRVDLRGLHPRRFVRRFTPDLALFFLAVCLTFTGFGAFFAPLPAYLGAVGVGDGGVFGLYLALNVAAAAFFGVAATLAERYEVTLVHAGGLAMRAGALPAVALAGGLLGPVTVLFAVIGLTWAVIAVTAGTLVSRLAPAIVRGEALGVYSAVSPLASGVGGIVGGWLAASGYGRAFAAAGGLVLVGTGVVLVLRRRVARRPGRTLYSTDRTE
jgi:MFS family permease